MADQTNVVSDNGEQSRMITLVTSDGERFEVSEAAARLSRIITHLIEDDCADGNIPLPNVTAKLLAKVLEYCNMHAAVVSCEADRDSSNAAESNEGELKSFDAGFIDVDQATLYDLLMAANYLEVKGLLDLACQKVADMIRGKTPEQMRETFGIENDLTPEKEEEIRRENRWVFDD